MHVKFFTEIATKTLLSLQFNTAKSHIVLYDVFVNFRSKPTYASLKKTMNSDIVKSNTSKSRGQNGVK